MPTTPANQGNSGGPVVDSSGNVVGILLEKLSDYYALARKEGIPQGMNFAVKADVVLAVFGRQGAKLQTGEVLPVPMNAERAHAAIASRVFLVRAERSGD